MSATTDDRNRELAQLVDAMTATDGLFDTAWPGLRVSRISSPIARVPVTYLPSLCVVVQGQKRIFLGGETYTYNPANYLVSPLAMPLEMEILAATRNHPVLGLGLEIDLAQVSELMLSIDDPTAATPRSSCCQKALFVSQTGPAIQDALIRLLKSLANPTDLRVLGPAITREVLYRLLQGEQSGQIRQLVQNGSSGHRVAGVVRYLSENFGERLSIEDIAQHAGMSPSSLHQKFREVTGMSPLQYLKKIRLHHARTAMVEQGLNAREAGYRVGYGNPSQFSREFKRMFGVPPAQLVKELLGAGG